MEDAQIIDLFLARSETAISQTAIRYGRYLKTIARNILPSEEDAEEVLNDVYLAAWSALPWIWALTATPVCRRPCRRWC